MRSKEEHICGDLRNRDREAAKETTRKRRTTSVHASMTCTKL